MKPSHVALTIAAVLISVPPASPMGSAADVPAPPWPNDPGAAEPAVPLAFTPLPPGRVVPRGWLRDRAIAMRDAKSPVTPRAREGAPTSEPPGSADLPETFGGADVYPDPAATRGLAIGHIDRLGAGATWRDLPAGSRLVFRYSAPVDARLTLRIDDRAATKVAFPATGKWQGGAYAVVAVPVEIAPGATVRLTFEAGDVPANIDVVEVQRSTSPSMKDLGQRVRLLFDGYMRDPSICRGPGGTYYLTGTTEGQRCIRLWESKDLGEWRRLDFEWTYGESPWHESYKKASRPLWAPEVHYLKGTFWLTYSMPTYTGEFKDSGSGLLRSTTGRPEGPYVDVSPDERLGDEIDASLFEDDDGAVYFVWHCGKIRKMRPDMSGPAEPGRKLRLSVPDPDPRHHSELCAKIHGADSFDHIGYEGAFLFKVGGTYFLTAADHCDGKYTSWVATSKSLYGPYGPRYPAIPDGGHNSYFRDSEGKWWSTIFNGPISEKPGILPIDISPDGQIGLRDG